MQQTKIHFLCLWGPFMVLPSTVGVHAYWDCDGTKAVPDMPLWRLSLVLIDPNDPGLRPANERRRYKVTPSLIGWAQT